VADWEWAQKQLDKHGDGEKIIHAVSCKHGENANGWLVATDQRIWFFQKGLFGGYEEYGYGTATSCQKIPMSFGKKVLRIGGEQFQMPGAEADQFASVVRRVRDGGMAG
jgi:hypothetical protein